MRIILALGGFMLIMLSAYSQQYIGNPVIKNRFTADPGVLVYNDTLYLFTGHDEQNKVDKWFYMRDWHVYSTDNMYDYTDNGALLSVNSFDWAKADAFASHAIEKNGKFWWYVSIRHKNIRVNEGFAIGVAVADHPLGPYTDAKGEAIITDETTNSIDLNIDPAVFTDDDGKSYLFWGSWGKCRMVELDSNMIDMKGAVKTVSTKNFFEAPFIHKYNGLYYLSYAGSGYPSKTEYSTSTSINGPWTYRGVINGLMPKSETNHQAIVEYKDQWYFIYHSSALPGGGVYRRSVCVDKLEYTEDGRIKRVVRTDTSVPSLSSTSGVKKKLNKGKALLYPNPLNNGTLYVDENQLKERGVSRIEIFNTSGRLVENIEINNENSNEISLLNGIYIASLVGAGYRENHKLVVQ